MTREGGALSAHTAQMQRTRATSRWSLRRRLLVTMVALFVLLTGAIAGASIVTMKAVLTSQLDDQLRSAVRTLAYSQSAPLGQVPPGTVWIKHLDGNIQGFDAYPGDGTDVYISHDDLLHLIAQAQQQPSAGAGNLSSFGEMRVTAVQYPDGSELIVAIPMRPVNQTVLALTFVIVVSVIVAALALAAIGDVLIRRALRPLTSVIDTTERISQLPLDSGEVQLSTRVVIDDPATEVGRVSESVNRMLNHIESSLESRAASERKVRQFVADASHELRTPLAAVHGYAEITRKHDRTLSEDARTSLTRIEAAADRMSKLVNDLLLLARLDEGREIEHREVDLSRLVVEAVADAQAASAAHPLDLDLPDTPVVVIGDTMRLQQVIANLLSNARTHTPEGTGVHVTLAADRDAKLATVTVRDDGPGIDPKLVQTIFERFVRGDASRSRAAGSSGLGLSIVRAIVQAHGGTITLTSEPGRTEFVISLPLAE